MSLDDDHILFVEYNYMKTSTKQKPPLVTKLGVSRQVAIPKKIHDELGLEPGNVFEVTRKGNQVILSPKVLIDKHPEIEARLREAEEDIKAGRVYGPFSSAKEMTSHLRKMGRERRKSKKTR